MGHRGTAQERPLSNAVQQIAGESFIYGLSQSVSRGLVFLLVPIYTRSLDPAEFGAAALIMSLIMLLVIVLTMGFDLTLVRSYLLASTDLDRRRTVAAAFWSQLAVASLFAGVMVVSAGSLSRWITGTGEQAGAVQVAALGILPTLAVGVLRTWLRAQRRPLASFVLNTSVAGLTLALAALFMVVLNMGVVGVFLASGAASGAAALAAARMMGGWLDPRLFTISKFMEMASLGVPMVPGSAAVWVVDLSDRFVVRYFDSAPDVATYQVAATLAAATSLGVAAFEQAWAPFVVSHYRDTGDTKAIGRILALFVAAVGGLVLLTLAAAGLLFPVLAPAEYGAPRLVVLLLAFSFLLVGARVVVNARGILSGTQRGVTTALISAAVLNLVLNLMLVPRMGIEGAALATVLAQLAAVIITYTVSQRLGMIPFRAGVAASLALLVIGSGLFAQFLRSNGQAGPLADGLAIVMYAIAAGLVLKVGGALERWPHRSRR